MNNDVKTFGEAEITNAATSIKNIVSKIEEECASLTTLISSIESNYSGTTGASSASAALTTLKDSLPGIKEAINSYADFLTANVQSHVAANELAGKIMN